MAGASPGTKRPQRAWEERALDRVRQQALQRGHRLVRAARELVAEGGLESVTLRALLDKTGLARRAFYGHFRSMDDVLLALFEDTMASGAARLREQLASIDDPIVALEHVVRTIASTALSPPERIYTLAMTQEHIRLAEHRPDELNAALAPMSELIADLLRAGMETGAVRETDATALSEVVHGLIAAEVHRNLHRGAEGTGWIDDLWEFCLGGIGRSARRRR
jgi:AcrR family transcriptional regulator